MTIDCRGEELILSKEKSIYWKKQGMLIVSDLHIGKSAHFRKHGLQIPDTIGKSDLQRLTRLMADFQPEILLITGDMFHHKINSDTNIFMEWRMKYSSLRVVLIKGNHDKLKHEDYEALGIEVHEKELLCFPFRFIHDKPKDFDEYYNITGHIHPGVVLHGKARQQLKFPCFHFSDTCAILPAFSVFTGLYILKPGPGDRFYAVTPDQVIQV